jgi:AcrR family transcriptional regulator
MTIEDVSVAEPAPRRTQKQRRDATIARLLDATIVTITEIGYARTSVKEICSRAGISHGGLFRHYNTRLDLVVAAAEEVSRRQLHGFADRFAARTGGDESLRDALALLRDAARQPMNAVWFELLVAARTDADLRVRLEPLARAYYDQIYTLAASLPFAADTSPEDLDRGVRLALHFFDGEAIRTAVAPEPGIEDDLLLGLGDLLANPPPAR